MWRTKRMKELRMNRTNDARASSNTIKTREKNAQPQGRRLVAFHQTLFSFARRSLSMQHWWPSIRVESDRFCVFFCRCCCVHCVFHTFAVVISQRITNEKKKKYYKISAAPIQNLISCKIKLIRIKIFVKGRSMEFSSLNNNKKAIKTHSAASSTCSRRKCE